MRYSFLCTTTWFIIFTGLVCADTDIQPIEANSVIEYKDFSYMVISVSDNADKPSQPQGQIDFAWISSRDENGSDLIHNINAKSGEMDFNDAGPGIYYVTLTVTKYGGGESTSVARKVCIGKEVYEQSCKGGTGDDDKSDDKTTPTTPDDNSTSSDDTASLDDCYIVASVPTQNQTYGRFEDDITFSKDNIFSIQAEVEGEACDEKYDIGIREHSNPDSLVRLVDTTDSYDFNKADKYEILIVDENKKIHFKSAKKTVHIVGGESASKNENDDDDLSDSSEGACYITVQFAGSATKFGEIDSYIEWNKTENDLDTYFELSDGCSEDYSIKIQDALEPKSFQNLNSAKIKYHHFENTGKYYALIIDAEGNDHSGSARKTIKIGKLCADYTGGTITLSEDKQNARLQIYTCEPIGNVRFAEQNIKRVPDLPEECGGDYIPPEPTINSKGVHLFLEDDYSFHPNRTDCSYKFQIVVEDDNGVSATTKNITLKVKKLSDINCEIDFTNSESFKVKVTPKGTSYDSISLQLSEPNYRIGGDSCSKLNLDVDEGKISLARRNQHDKLIAKVTDGSSQIAECYADLTQDRYDSTLMVHFHEKSGGICEERNYDRADSNKMPSVPYRIAETVRLDLYVDKDKLGTCSDSANISVKITFDGATISLTANDPVFNSEDPNAYFDVPIKQRDNDIVKNLLDYTLPVGLDNKYEFEISLRDGNGDYCKYAGKPITMSFVVDVML